MKPGDLIYSPDVRSQQDRTSSLSSTGVRLILEEYHEPGSKDLGFPPFRVFKMLESDGRITEWGADNIERYWRVVE